MLASTESSTSAKVSVTVAPFYTVIAVKVGSVIVAATQGSVTVTWKVSKSLPPFRNTVVPVYPAEVTVMTL